MSILNSLFDVMRGYEGPHKQHATISETFAPASGYTPQEGDVVVLNANREVVAADNASLRTNNTSVQTLAESLVDAPQMWLVISGATSNDYDGLQQTGAPNAIGTLGYVPARCQVIRGHYMFKTQRFVAQAYTPLTKVTVGTGATAGQLDLASAHRAAGYTALAFGQALEYTAASGSTPGSLVVVAGAM